MAGNLSLYGTLQSRPVAPDVSQPTFGTPTQGINYQLPNSSLRSGGDTTNINTFGNLTQSQRINAIGQTQYEQAAGKQLGNNLLMQQDFQTGLNSLAKSPAADRNAIFDSWRAMGLLPATGGSLYPGNAAGGIPGSWTNQSAPGSLENKFAAYNNGVYGAANRAALRFAGIDPNSITAAYQKLMGGQ